MPHMRKYMCDIEHDHTIVQQMRLFLSRVFELRAPWHIVDTGAFTIDIECIPIDRNYLS